MNAKQRAERLKRQCEVAGRVDLKRVANLLGLEVDYRTFNGAGVEEIAVSSCIAVRDDMPEDKQRWAIAHAIGHHVMHGSSWNQVWLRTCTQLPDKLEAQADRLAFHLLVDQAEAIREGLNDVGQIAEYYGVPVEMVAVQGRLV